MSFVIYHKEELLKNLGKQKVQPKLLLQDAKKDYQKFLMLITSTKMITRLPKMISS